LRFPIFYTYLKLELMTVLSKEKASYAIQTFIMFLNITKENQPALIADIEGLQEQAYLLLEKIVGGQLGPLTASLQLNGLIEKLNLLITAPYPSVLTDSSENLVKGGIVAFEHYLNQELKAHHITVQQEAPLFNDSLNLWEKVGVSLTAKEGASELAALVEKLNSLLPDNEKYPLPDINQY
jgi:hypothetical protein